MKKFLTLSAFVFMALTANAQYVTYQSTYEQEELQEAPIQKIQGYLKTSKGWVRINLKVKELSNSIRVVGYKEKNTSQFAGAFAEYGNPDHWRNCNARAEGLSVFSDGQTAVNNFDYKAYISGLGTVYF